MSRGEHPDPRCGAAAMANGYDVVTPGAPDGDFLQLDGKATVAKLTCGPLRGHDVFARGRFARSQRHEVLDVALHARARESFQKRRHRWRWCYRGRSRRLP